MRIISGKFGGRRFKVPKGLPVRPTTDQAREGIFNILVHQYPIDGSRVLDLFSGTGGMGLEFLSRGAAKCVFVDQSKKCTSWISTCIRNLNISEDAEVITAPVDRALGQIQGKFDFIFLDPPYEMPGISGLVSSILSSGLLEEDGILILEHRKLYNFSEVDGYYDGREYGDSVFSFFSTS